MKIIIFNGGRGATSIINEIKKYKNFHITSVVNAYDDGISTGEIRKFFNMLGPSDIRKVQANLIDDNFKDYLRLFDFRFSSQTSFNEGLDILHNFEEKILSKYNIDDQISKKLSLYNKQFLKVIKKYKKNYNYDFSFNDCSLLNCLYAGGFVNYNYNFFETINNFKKIFKIKHDVLPNSNDNLKMIALREDGRVLYSESEIVNLRSNVKIHDFFLIDYQTNIDEKMINQLSFEKKLSFFKELHCTPSMNPELEDRIKSADLIIYSPGTQHSSLLPTYLTNNLGKLISDNKDALKVFITNIGADYENPVYIASDYVKNAFKYLNKSLANISNPKSLINYLVINDNNKIDPNKVNFDQEEIKRLEIKFAAKNYETSDYNGQHNGYLVFETILNYWTYLIENTNSVNHS